MHILVVGAGAMGCLFSAYLKEAGHEVALLEIRQEAVDAINRAGVQVEGLRGSHAVKVPASLPPPRVEPDLVLMCVKAYDTLRAAEGIRDALKPDSRVLTLQNGVGNVKALEEVLGKEKVLAGITAEGATVLGPGRVRHAGLGDTILQAGPDTDRILSALHSAGFRTRAEEDIDRFIWGKLLVNVGINALAAITRLKNGRLPECQGSRQIMERAVGEALAVTQALGIAMPYADPVGRVVEVCRNTAGNVASMLQDVIKHRPTEIEAINGAVVREGKRLGIPTPVNFTLTCLVSVVQETYEESVT